MGHALDNDDDDACMRRNGYLGASGQKSDSTIAPASYFPIRRENFHYPIRLETIFHVFVHNFIRPCDIVLRPFDLGDVC